MFIFIIRPTQIHRRCIFDLFNTITYFGCPHQPPSATHKKGKWERSLPFTLFVYLCCVPDECC